MHDEARVREQPAPDGRRLVRRVLSSTRWTSSSAGLRVDRVQELLNSIARWRRCTADHLPGGDVEPANRDVVPAVCSRGCRARDRRAHRQERLGAVECLDLRLLVDAQHDGAFGRVEIQTDDVPHLVDEERVGRTA